MSDNLEQPDRIENLLRRWGAQQAADAARLSPLRRRRRVMPALLRWAPLAAAAGMLVASAALFVAAQSSKTGSLVVQSAPYTDEKQALPRDPETLLARDESEQPRGRGGAGGYFIADKVKEQQDSPGSSGQADGWRAGRMKDGEASGIDGVAEPQTNALAAGSDADTDASGVRNQPQFRSGPPAPAACIGPEAGPDSQATTKGEALALADQAVPGAPAATGAVDGMRTAQETPGDAISGKVGSVLQRGVPGRREAGMAYDAAASAPADVEADGQQKYKADDIAGLETQLAQAKTKIATLEAKLAQQPGAAKAIDGVEPSAPSAGLLALDKAAATTGREAASAPAARFADYDLRLASVEAQLKTLMADAKTAYLSAAAPGKTGLAASQRAAASAKLQQRLAAIQKTDAALAKPLAQQIDGLLTRLAMLQADDAQAVARFTEALDKSGVIVQIDQAMASSSPAARALLLEVRFVLT